MPCKRPKLVTATAASASETTLPVAGGPPDISSGAAATTTSPGKAQPGLSRSTIAVNQPTDSSVLCSTTATTPPVTASTLSSTMIQPSSVSTLTGTDWKPEVGRPGLSFSLPANNPTTSLSTAVRTNEVDESPKQQTAASTALNSLSQPEMSTTTTTTTTVDLLAVSRIPVDVNDNDFVLATSGSRLIQFPLSLAAVDQSPSNEMRLDANIQLEKLENNYQFIDLEVLAKMPKSRQADEKRTGLERAQSTQQRTGVDARSLETTLAVASTSALSLLPSKSLTTTKSSRSGSERKERDESWQKYLKRLVCPLHSDKLISLQFLRVA